MVKNSGQRYIHCCAYVVVWCTLDSRNCISWGQTGILMGKTIKSATSPTICCKEKLAVVSNVSTS
jgi:hypothetical protein